MQAWWLHTFIAVLLNRIINLCALNLLGIAFNAATAPKYTLQLCPVLDCTVPHLCRLTG